MLDEIIYDDMRDEVRSFIVNAIMNIRDMDGNSIKNKNVIKLTTSSDSPAAQKGYQFNSSYFSEYKDEHGMKWRVPGTIVALNRFVMPTDSVIADSLLGHGDILDTHIRGIQNEELRERMLNNDMKEKEVEKLNLAETIVKESTAEKAKTFEEVFARYDNNFS